MKKARILIAGALLLLSGAGLAQSEKSKTEKEIYGGATFLNKQDDGYRGIWYMINGAGQAGPVENQYRFKYSGGMATYPANHYPLSIYVPEVTKTFFFFGVTDKDEKTLQHIFPYFDQIT